jgi:uridine kinase
MSIDIIVPRGVENRVAISKCFHRPAVIVLTIEAMVIQYIERKLIEKSKAHRAELKKLGQSSEGDPLSETVILLEQTPQLRGMNTIVQDIDTSAEEFIFYFDRLATLLVEQCVH